MLTTRLHVFVVFFCFIWVAIAFSRFSHYSKTARPISCKLHINHLHISPKIRCKFHAIRFGGCWVIKSQRNVTSFYMYIYIDLQEEDIAENFSCGSARFYQNERTLPLKRTFLFCFHRFSNNKNFSVSFLPPNFCPSRIFYFSDSTSSCVKYSLMVKLNSLHQVVILFSPMHRRSYCHESCLQIYHKDEHHPIDIGSLSVLWGPVFDVAQQWITNIHFDIIASYTVSCVDFINSAFLLSISGSFRIFINLTSLVYCRISFAIFRNISNSSSGFGSIWLIIFAARPL